MSVADRIREGLRTFLRLEPSSTQTFAIAEEHNFYTNAIANRLWYRGSASELNQFYNQLGSDTCPFWGAVPTSGLEIRKIHTGLPKNIVNMLTHIVIRDMNDMQFSSNTQSELWRTIAKENKLEEILTEATRDVLTIGDGAMKISIDTSVSEYPILEWVSGENIDISYSRGRLKEIIFKTEYRIKGKTYFLMEKYGFGYIRYELYRDEKQISLNALEETKDLEDVSFDKSFMLAIPYKIIPSDRWKGRGQSIFEGKTDNFDALDEAWSQWMHALRTSRPVKYIPESLIPRNENNGKLLKPNPFDNQFIEIESSMAEGAKNQIDTQQPDFPAESYVQTYITALDLALQGIISPSTLGIDVKKLDNAESQREKEKATLYTRGIIVEALSCFMVTLVEAVFKAYYTSAKKPFEKVQVSPSFGEYANPSFEATVETVSNPNSPLSLRTRVEELWGDSRDEEWKKEEVRMIKEEQGIAMLDEPALGVDAQ